MRIYAHHFFLAHCASHVKMATFEEGGVCISLIVKGPTVFFFHLVEGSSAKVDLQRGCQYTVTRKSFEHIAN